MNNFDAEKALALLLDRGQGSSSKNPPNTLKIQPVVKVSGLILTLISFRYLFL